MITHETPLTEIAQFLPPAAAALLGASPQQVQEAVLTTVRAVLFYLQEERYKLDPVTMEGVLNAFVFSMTPMHIELIRAYSQMEGMHKLLKLQADILKHRKGDGDGDD